MKPQQTERNTMVRFYVSCNAVSVKVCASNEKLQYSTLSTLINYSFSEMERVAYENKRE
jgi:hypothetical protein